MFTPVFLGSHLSHPCVRWFLIASCDDLSVTLQPVSRQGERKTVALAGSADILSFNFDNVLPGKYKGHLNLLLIICTEGKNLIILC